MNPYICRSQDLDGDTMRAFILMERVPWYDKGDYRCAEPDPSTFPMRWATGQRDLPLKYVDSDGYHKPAAEGYARSTGKVGVVLVTSGPGATNAVTGLTDALMDSVPIVCLAGQVPSHLIGTDAFQEADTSGITRPCTKHNYLVKNS